MTTTAQQCPPQPPPAASDERRTLPWALIVALIALAALTIAVVTWQLASPPTRQRRCTLSPRPQPTNWPPTGPAARSTSSRSPSRSRPTGPVPARRLGLPAAGPQGRSRPTGPLPARRLGLPTASPQGRKLTAPAGGSPHPANGWRRPTCADSLARLSRKIEVDDHDDGVPGTQVRGAAQCLGVHRHRAPQSGHPSSAHRRQTGAFTLEQNFVSSGSSSLIVPPMALRIG